MDRDERAAFDAWMRGLTRTQQRFIAWNAERLGIDEPASARRYFRSWRTWQDGHGGRAFRDMGTLMHRTYAVFHDDSPAEAFAAYALHGPMHFLRMLSYPEPTIGDGHVVFRTLAALERVTITDFGCGLAQVSRTLARRLADAGVTVELVLADIPTVRKEFLLWLGRDAGIPTRFLDCTAETPIPDLPASDMVVATETFEHMHDPLRCLQTLDAAMRPGGLLLTDVGDHQAEPFHVTPGLGDLREHLAGGGFRMLIENRLYQKV